MKYDIQYMKLVLLVNNLKYFFLYSYIFLSLFYMHNLYDAVWLSDLQYKLNLKIKSSGVCLC